MRGNSRALAALWKPILARFWPIHYLQQIIDSRFSSFGQGQPFRRRTRPRLAFSCLNGTCSRQPNISSVSVSQILRWGNRPSDRRIDPSVSESGFFILQIGDIYMLNRMQIEGVVLKSWTYAGTPFARMVNRTDPGVDGGDILFIARLPAKMGCFDRQAVRVTWPRPQAWRAQAEAPCGAYLRSPEQISPRYRGCRCPVGRALCTPRRPGRRRAVHPPSSHPA